MAEAPKASSLFDSLLGVLTTIVIAALLINRLVDAIKPYLGAVVCWALVVATVLVIGYAATAALNRYRRW